MFTNTRSVAALAVAASIALAVIALTAAPSNAAIIVERTAVGGDGRESSNLASFTTTAETDLLLVGNAGYFTEGAATAMSFNGKSLTEVPNSHGTYSSGHETVFYYLFNPGAHTGAVSVTRSGKDWSDTDEIVAYAIGGVTAIDQIVASTTSSGSGDEISLTQTVSGSGLAIDLLAVELNSSINPSPGTGQTEVMDAVASDNDGKFNQSSTKSFTGGSVTMSYDFGNTTVDRGAAYGMVTLVPEPGTLALLSLGGLGVLVRRRRG